MSTASHLPVPHNDHDRASNLLATAPRFGQMPGVGPILSSFDVSTPEGKMALFNALQGESQDANGWLNTELLIVNVVCHPVEFEGENGEPVKSMRTVLVLKGGEQVAFVAESIYKAIHMIAFAFGQPPWPDGLKCRLSQEDLGNQRRWYKLTPIISVKAKK